MKKAESIVATSAERVIHRLSRRRFDGTHRLSEGLVSSLLVHEMLSLRPSWRNGLWNEARPCPGEDGERVDMWIERGPRSWPLVIELKVFDPANASSNGKYVGLCEVVSDCIKLAEIINYKQATAGLMVVCGRTDYWRGVGKLSELAQPDGPERFVGSPGDLVPGKTERRYAYLKEWYKRGSRVPRRIVLDRVHRSERKSLGVWLWRVSLP